MKKGISELPDPAHFYEVAFEVPQLGVGFADLVGKRELRAEPEHRDRAVEQRGLQDPGVVLAGGVIGHEWEPPGSRNSVHRNSALAPMVKPHGNATFVPTRVQYPALAPGVGNNVSCC